MVDLTDGAHNSRRLDVVALGDATCDHPDYDNPYFNRCWSYYQHPTGDQGREPYADPAPDRIESRDEAGWREALDEAIAKVTREEYSRLKRKHDVTARLTDAFKSIGRLWATGGKPPRYDQWDALLYVSWYQARQVHLVCAVFDQLPPPPSGKPLRVVDFGCGAWAVPIALAILEARGHAALLDREVSIHGIERASPMTRIGEKLWLEFGCAAEARGLPIDFMDMIDEDGIFTSAEAYRDSPARDASAESWLLAIHALYDEPQPAIGPFLVGYRERHASHLRYELLTTHKRKQQILEGIIDKGSGERIGPQQPSCLTPIWDGTLTKTTACRREIHRELGNSGSPMRRSHMDYLWKRVAWNPIQQDAIWVRRPSP